MHFSTKMTLASGLLLTLATPTLLAKVPAEQAAQLGGDKLTYIGAEKAANADGSIPAWDGGFPQSRIPANWKPGDVYTKPLAGRQAAVHDHRAERRSVQGEADAGPAGDVREVPLRPTRFRSM
jgi:hypothetical protein